jgi:PPOX class probable FMN-dependent enzyme
MHSLLLYAVTLITVAAFTKGGKLARHLNNKHLGAKRVVMAALSASSGNNEGRGSWKGATSSSETECWRSRIDRSIAKSRKIRGGNYVQVATVDEQGSPACRTVVFRGFMDVQNASIEEAQADNEARPSSIALKMITDARSEKVAQIRQNPACEIVWWFSQSSEQYRFAGKLLLVGHDTADEALLAARKQQWGNLSDPAREQFFWPPPGAYSDEVVVQVPPGGRDEEGKVLPPPDCFLLMMLVPHQVKYLRLTDNFAQSDVLGAEGEWAVARINP